MQDIVQKQRDFFDSRATHSIPFRIQQLKKLKKLIKANEEVLFEAIYADFKKSSFETYVSELALVYHDIDDACKNIYKWSRKKKVPTNFVNFPAKSYVLSEPLGVSLVIGAWNYPYQLSFAPMVAAMAAGCTVVLKPSEIPSRTSAVMEQLISENFSDAYLKVVEGGVPETTALLEQAFDKIFFTGSTAVGKIVYKAAAQNLIPVTLELGGKSPAFVTADCNLKITVKRLIWAKFLNAGQTCISPDYVMVEKSIEQKFLALCKAEIEKEHYAFDNGNYPQIVNDRNFKRLAEMLDTSKVYHGGQLDATQRYMAPTLMHQVDFNDKVMQEEIFGPILPVITFTDLDAAIAEVKKLPKPLSCYVFTNNRKAKKKVLERISFGGGAVNEAVTHITNSHMPFGGVGPSGIGSYHGEAGFSAFSNYKGILEKSTLLELPLKYFPQTKGKLWWIKQFFKL